MADEKEKENVTQNQIESKIVKKSIAQRIATFLLSKDYKAIFGGVYKNILSPELKKIALSAINAIARDVIYSGSGVEPPAQTEYREYNSYSGDGRYGSETRRYRDSKEITYSSRQEAEDVLRQMRDMIKRKGIVTMADYYVFSNQSPLSTHYDFGWWKLDQVTIYSYGQNGQRRYGLRLPEPMPIDKRS